MLHIIYMYIINVKVLLYYCRNLGHHFSLSPLFFSFTTSLLSSLSLSLFFSSLAKYLSSLPEFSGKKWPIAPCIYAYLNWMTLYVHKQEVSIFSRLDAEWIISYPVRRDYHLVLVARSSGQCVSRLHGSRCLWKGIH